MAAPIDPPRDAPKREELDDDELARYLGVAAVPVRQFPSGHSNLTYLVRAGETEWVLRRPPFGSTVKTAHDMGREYRILSHLSAVYPLAPRPRSYCEDPSLIGAPFYVMGRIRGVILRKDPP